MNVLKLLKKDHSEVESLFTRFDGLAKTAHDKRSEVVARVRYQLQIHSKAEEEIFYSALKALNSDGRRLVSQANKEHREINELLAQLSRLKPTDRNFDEKFETLIENVVHHVQEEEGEIFQFAEKNCSAQQLEDLGRQIEERKRILSQEMVA